MTLRIRFLRHNGPGWGFVLIIVIVAKKHCSLGFVIYAFTLAFETPRTMLKF